MNEVLIILGLILLNGVFAMSEVALISARKSKLTSDAKKGSRSAKVALELANDPDRFLSTVQIGITLIGILTGMFSGNKIAQDMTQQLLSWGVPANYAFLLGQGIIIVVVTFLSIILGELVPKRIGMGMAEKMATLISRPMKLLSILSLPFVWALSKSTALIFSFLHISDKQNKVTEEEIKSMIEVGTADGEVQPVEQDIVHRVFLMGDLKVASIMTHKGDIVWLEYGMSALEVMHIVRENMYEAYPVAKKNLDHVVGMVYLKDLFLTLDKADFSLESILRQPLFFHENAEVYKVIDQIKKERVSRALVCDEFGACMGIITLKDILEGLIGNFDEQDTDPFIVKRKDADGWLVDGLCPFYDFLIYFQREDLFEKSEYHTLAGLLIYQLQHIPQCGEVLLWKGFRFEVVDMDGVRIDKVMVSISSPTC